MGFVCRFQALMKAASYYNVQATAFPNYVHFSLHAVLQTLKVLTCLAIWSSSATTGDSPDCVGWQCSANGDMLLSVAHLTARCCRSPHGVLCFEPHYYPPAAATGQS